MMKRCIICLRKLFMTELSKKYGNTKNWIRFADMEKGIFLAVMVLVLKEWEKACLWMNFSRVHCGKDWIFMWQTDVDICQQV